MEYDRRPRDVYKLHYACFDCHAVWYVRLAAVDIVVVDRSDVPTRLCGVTA